MCNGSLEAPTFVEESDERGVGNARRVAAPHAYRAVVARRHHVARAEYSEPPYHVRVGQRGGARKATRRVEHVLRVLFGASERWAMGASQTFNLEIVSRIRTQCTGTKKQLTALAMGSPTPATAMSPRTATHVTQPSNTLRCATVPSAVRSAQLPSYEPVMKPTSHGASAQTRCVWSSSVAASCVFKREYMRGGKSNR